MDIFNLTMTRLFDFLLYPFGHIHPMWGLTAISILTGSAMVWISGRISNQQRIRALKTKVKGHMLEMWIFRDSPAAALKAQGRVVWNATKYAAHSLRTLAILMVLIVPIMIQLQARYGYEPLQPGHSTIVKATYAGPVSPEAMDLKLEAPEGVDVETPPLRIPESREVDFRIRAKRAGIYRLLVNIGNQHVGKMLCVGTVGVAMSPLRSRSRLDRFFYPAERAMPAGPLSSIEVRYPTRRLPLGGIRFHWLWPFLLISIAAGLVTKHFLKIEL